MSKTKYKAAKYIRLSHADDNAGESDSVVNQRSFLNSFIDSQADIEAVSEMVDDGYSGVLFDRPAFKLMMQEIAQGNINCVIVKDLSRLGREYIETGRYLRNIFPAYGVRFIAVNDNIDTLKEGGDGLTVSFKNLVNDTYCRDISVKTRSALNAKREQGDYVGACTIYGYKKDENNNNHLVIDEYPAGIVRDIFRMKIDGMSALKIAETLNSLGVLSPMEYKRDRGLPHPTGGFSDKEGGKWSATTVFRILKDETYTGTLVQGKQSTPNYKVREVFDKPESEWVRVENVHEAIINKHDFITARNIMRLDTRSAPEGNVYCFSGMLICDSCGNRMTRKTVTYKDKKYFYYYCPTGKKHGCEKPVMLKEQSLNACILESLKSHIANIVSLESVIADSDMQKKAVEFAKRCDMQIAENESRIKRVKRLKSTLYENMITGAITNAEFKAYKAEYTQKIDELTEAIEKLTYERENALAGKSERLRWTENFKKFQDLTEIDRRMVVCLIKSICVKDKNKLQITFNYQDEYEKALALFDKGRLSEPLNKQGEVSNDEEVA